VNTGAVSEKRFSLFPPICLVSKIRSLWTNDTKSMTGRRFHNPPGFNLLYAYCPQLFQSANLRFDIVRLNVNVHSTGVFDVLQLNM
jgi:hypothetical protein